MLMTVDPPRAPTSPRRARYLEIAEDLQRRIRAGDFPTGKLPSQAEHERDYRTSTVTVRAAVKQLVKIGIVESRQGSGTYVLQRDLVTIHVTLTENLSRRRRVAGLTGVDSWSSDIVESGHDPHQRFECLNVAADQRVADILDVHVDDPLVVRRCWRCIDGVPASIETSYFPRWLVNELPELAAPHDIAQGTTLWISDNGHPMAHHSDTVLARLVTDDEASFFEAPPGFVTLVRSRVSYDPDWRVLRLMDTSYRADMHQLRFEVPADGEVEGPPT
jgi:DNA-binding GntR family transcriptional regulator